MPTPRPLNSRQLQFCRLVAEGAKQVDAYRQTFGVDDRTRACKLAAKANIKEEISRLQKAADKASNVSRDSILQDLETIWRAKPSEATMDNPLCEVRMSKAGPYAAFPDKSRVLERLAKMRGWDAPDQHNHTVTVEVVIGGDAQ